MTGALILAGGVSERMGMPKAFLKINHSTFLERIVEVYKTAGIDKIVVVINGEISGNKIIKELKGKGIIFIRNFSPEIGRFFSIKKGIKKLSDCHNCFIHNIDNPFIEVTLIKSLVNRIKKGSFVVPVYHSRGGHPVLISKEIISYINKLNGFDFHLKEILREFSRINVVIKIPEILWNINTPEDYLIYINK